MRDPLLNEFQQLEAEPTKPHRRGRAFEDLIARLFRAAHFDVRVDPRAAAPRQTDLIATLGTSAYLVEAKWRKATTTVADVASLFDRLDRLPNSMVGILISVSGHSIGALKMIEDDRHRGLIVPLDGAEIARLLSVPLDMRRTLRRKAHDLTVHGSLAAPGPSSRDPLRSADGQLRLADPGLRFAGTDGERSARISAVGNFLSATFTREVLDIDWVSGGGYGVSWDLPLEADTEQDLFIALAELSAIEWAGEAGHWCLSQRQRNWHGLGARPLADAISAREERYADLTDLHHTEQLTYADVCPEGFYTLSADLAADSESGRIWHPVLSFQLFGIPLDLDPLKRLAEALAPAAETYFRPRSSEAVQRAYLERRDRIELEVLAAIIEPAKLDLVHGEDWVLGLIARNPFHEGEIEPETGSSDLDRLLAESEQLLCELGSWHPLGEARTYYLSSIEWARSSEALLICPRARWDDPPGRRGVDRAPGSPRVSSPATSTVELTELTLPASG